MFKIQRTKRFVLLGAVGLVAWMTAVTIFLQGEAWKAAPAPAAVEGALNLSLLFAMVLFIWCLVRLFLLTAGCLTECTPLTVLWALALSLVPFLLLAWLLRKLLRHGISALEQHKETWGDRSIGL